MPPSVFKAYDIRGVYPQELDEDLVRRVGAAFAKWTGADRIIVGRDMRPSGVSLSEAFIEGATSMGTNVVDIGLASTDLTYFASGYLNAPAAMFTASHNPARYNGIKLCNTGAAPIGSESGLTDIELLSRELLPACGNGSVEKQDLLEKYADHVVSFVDTSVLRPLKIVIDTANGMGGLVAPAVFSRLPFDVEILYPELDGTFPNHPADPIQPENTADLRALVLSRHADIGLAFDGDADRVFVVDEKAQGMSGSLTTAIVAKAMLERFPGSTVLYNLICSHAVAEVIEESGGKPVRTRVGHSFIKSVMAETGAVFGGEHSGHYYFRDNYRADSGLIAAVVILELLCKAEVPLSQLRQPFERYADSGEINTEVKDTKAVLDAIASRFADVAELDWTDGLTVTLGDWWFNLRGSNTEPLLRLNLEARDAKECKTRVAEVTALIREMGGAS